MNILKRRVSWATGLPYVVLAFALAVGVLGMSHDASSQEMQEDSGEIPNVSGTLAKNFPVAPSLSANVNAKIATLAQADQSRVKAAVDAGAKFIQQYLDEFACLTDYPDWDNQIAPFVEDRDKISQTCEKIKPPEVTNQGTKYYLLRELCSNPSLIDFKLYDDTVSLTYQISVLGNTTYRTPSSITSFTPEKFGVTEQIVVVIGASNKATSFLPADWKYQRVYSSTLWEVDVDSHSKNALPPNSSAAWIAHVAQYREIAAQIKQQAKRVCR